jgi:hypothetical protein
MFIFKPLCLSTQCSCILATRPTSLRGFAASPPSHRATIQTAYHSPSDRRAAAGLSLGLIDVACHPAFSRASLRQWLLLRNAHPTIRSQHTNVPDISHLTHYLLVHPEARFLLRNIPCPRRNDRAGLPQSRRIRMNIALLIGEQAFAYIPLVHLVVSKNAEQNFLEGLKRAE